MKYRPFEELFSIPLRNGLTKPKRVRGEGYKMVNMGELFKYPRMKNVPMDRVPLTENEYSTSLIEPNDLLFARQSLVLEGAGQCSIFLEDDEEVCFESHLIRCRLNPEVANPLFYYYFFLSRLGKQAIYTIVEQGAGASGIRGSDLAKVLVPDVDLGVQNKIAEIIHEIDSKIELNRRTNQTLEHIAQALFKCWFVDFEPTRAKIIAKEKGANPATQELAAQAIICGAMTLERLEAITQNLETTLQQAINEKLSQANQTPINTEQLKTTAALFPNALVDSEFGEIPEGWEVACIEDVCNFQNGYAFKSKEMTKSTLDTYKVFKMGHIKKGGGLNQAGTKDYYEKEKCEKLERYLIKKGDLLMCMTDMKNNVALLGHTALVDVDDEYILNQRVGLLRSKDVKKANYPFLYILTNSEVFLEDLRSRANSGVQVNLSTKEIKETNFILPTEAVHIAFDNVVERAQENRFSLEAEQVYLAELRDVLLPKLLSGELTVS